MTQASLAYRKNEAAIHRGDVPEKYFRLLSHIPGQRILEIGSAEGVLALLLAKHGKTVTALERNQERHNATMRVVNEWSKRADDLGDCTFICGDISGRLDLLYGVDTLVAVRMIYYLGDDLDLVFAEAAKHVRNIVLCGNGNRARRWREGITEETKANNYYASREGMRALLERHGYRITNEVTEGDEIVVGSK